MPIIAQAFFVFVAMIFVDFAWSVYIKSLADDKVWKAGLFSALILLSGAFTSINYIENHWMLIPAAIGGCLGTVLSKYFTKLSATQKTSTESQ